MKTFTSSQKWTRSTMLAAHSVMTAVNVAVVNATDFGWTYGNKSRHALVPVHTLISQRPPGDSS